MNDLKKIIFIVGPTAVGKSEIAFSLAQKVQGEIISCDSMQVYKEIRIASNKPPAVYLKDVPHHLIDFVPIEEDFDVSQFNTLSLSLIPEIHQRKRIPIIAGGTGLYMQILLDGLFNSQDRDEELRQELFALAEGKGKEHLYAMLKERDSECAQRIHPNDLKKVVRALEVCIQENRPMSEMQKERAGIWGRYAISLYCINTDRQKLYERIEARVEEMFEEGIVQEMESISDRTLSRGVMSIIGVKEIFGFLKNEYDCEHAKDLMKLHTRRLAKRQLTWFRKDKRIQWFDLTEKTQEEILNNIMEENRL